MLAIQDLDVSIRAVSILRGVSLRVEAGATAGLIGRNGAGKTTLMRAVMGLLSRQGGQIQVGEQQLDRSVPAYQRARFGIGYMPEDRRLVPELSVRENVLAPAWACKAADAQARLERVFEMIPEVRDFAQRRALELSGGQQKLVALARALMMGDKLLLLDEPFEGVAPVLARRLAEVISGLRRHGLTVLVSESDLKHSAAMLDQMIVIDRGSITKQEALPRGT
jgi:branched-chain amino acid transport system ATP-binding protein